MQHQSFIVKIFLCGFVCFSYMSVQAMHKLEEMKVSKSQEAKNIEEGTQTEDFSGREYINRTLCNRDYDEYSLFYNDEERDQAGRKIRRPVEEETSSFDDDRFSGRMDDSGRKMRADIDSNEVVVKTKENLGSFLTSDMESDLEDVVDIDDEVETQ